MSLKRSDFALLQHVHTVYKSLISQYKFQLPNYVIIAKKAEEMDNLLLDLRQKFDASLIQDDRAEKKVN